MTFFDEAHLLKISVRTLHWTVPLFLLEQDKARYFDVVETFFPSKTKDFWRRGNIIRNEGEFVRRPSIRPMVVLTAEAGIVFVAVSSVFSSVAAGGFLSPLSLSQPTCAVVAFASPEVTASAGTGFLVESLAPALLLLFPNEKFPGKTSKNFPLPFSKFGTTQADRVSWMSCPLQIFCNKDPGLRADASCGKLGCCDATGQSERRIGGGAAGASGSFFRFRMDSEDVAVAAFLGVRLAFALGVLNSEDGIVLMVILRLTATDRFVGVAEAAFFFLAEDGAMIR